MNKYDYACNLGYGDVERYSERINTSDNYVIACFYSHEAIQIAGYIDGAKRCANEKISFHYLNIEFQVIEFEFVKIHLEFIKR